MATPGYFTAARDYMREVVGGHGRSVHMERAADWVCTLDPSADQAVLPAAVMHDIERSSIKVSDASDHTSMDEPGYLTAHQHASAIVAREFLIQQRAPLLLINRVYELISVHEIGGDPEANLLKDADSLSFFENNVERFLEGWGANDRTKHKFEWMYERISSDQAKQLAQPFYQKAMAAFGEAQHG